MASHWTPEGEFISDDGTSLRGRPAIEKAYAEFFKKSPKPQAEVEVQSLRFLSKDTAVEEGYFKVHRGKSEEKATSRTSVLYVREDGKWLMAVVREWPGEGREVPPCRGYGLLHRPLVHDRSIYRRHIESLLKTGRSPFVKVTVNAPSCCCCWPTRNTNGR